MCVLSRRDPEIIMAKHLHAPETPSLLYQLDPEGKPTSTGKHSGGNEDSKEFKDRYGLKPSFQLDCSACCWTFLVTKRSYAYETNAGKINLVHFGDPLNLKPQRTLCFLTCGWEHGRLMTDCSSNPLQHRFRRITHGSNTFQLYTSGSSEPTAISMGDSIIARFEGIAFSNVTDDVYDVTHVNDKNVEGVDMNYYDAALMEYFRMKNDQGPLKGKCEYGAENPVPRPPRKISTTPPKPTDSALTPAKSSNKKNSTK